MVNLVRGIRFLMQRNKGFGHVVHRNDIDPIRRAKRQERQSRQKHECPDHIKLRCFGPATVAEHDARTKHSSRNIVKQLAHHVFAEFFRPRVWIVVGAVPIDRSILGHHFVAAVARHGNRGNLAEAAQAVQVVGTPSKLHDFQSPAQIHIETRFFGFAVERSRAMNHRFGRANEVRILGRVQSKMRLR